MTKRKRIRVEGKRLRRRGGRRLGSKGERGVGRGDGEKRKGREGRGHGGWEREEVEEKSKRRDGLREGRTCGIR